MNNKKKTILITSALPYANGPIHVGHLLEYIQTDIYVRAMKLFGHTCHYVCADDAHGTPIMLKAKKLNKQPEDMIEEMRELHLADFQKFNIEFDIYDTTHSDENRENTVDIYSRLYKKGLIKKQSISQYYDEIEGIFLPDRYLVGTCPKCKSENQYSDGCDKCGAVYAPFELLQPKSTISDSKPVVRETDHLLFKLNESKEFLKEYITSGVLQPEMVNKMKEWLDDEDDLKVWDISREEPYFGFEIPDEPNKYFYVWLDAPIGYISATEKLFNGKKKKFNEYWGKDSVHELIHVIGKDIAYFHSLFWPAILHSAGYRIPSKIQCHGFVTINGEKMSKTKGNYYTASDWAEKFNPEYLRYYYASKINGRIADLDLNIDDFTTKVNSDIVGKLVNIPSRCAKLLEKYCDNTLIVGGDNPFSQKLMELSSQCEHLYNNWVFSEVVKITSSMADEINAYISQAEPWRLFKTSNENNHKHAHQVISNGLESYRILITCLAPIVPDIAHKSMLLYKNEKLEWISKPLTSAKINTYQQLSSRVVSE